MIMLNQNHKFVKVNVDDWTQCDQISTWIRLAFSKMWPLRVDLVARRRVMAQVISNMNHVR